jgi:hypothetical protein
VWLALDDASPPEADLFAPTALARARCWDGQSTRFIDHIVLSRTLGSQFVPESFVQHRYDAVDKRYRKQLSDHCPIALRLRTSPRATAPQTTAPRTTAPQTTAPSAATSSQTAPRTTTPPNPTALAPNPDVTLLPVKGNHTRKGQRHYHTPDCPQYAQVKIDTAKGEQLFQDEATARAAGYERSPDCKPR